MVETKNCFEFVDGGFPGEGLSSLSEELTING